MKSSGRGVGGLHQRVYLFRSRCQDPALPCSTRSRRACWLQTEGCPCLLSVAEGHPLFHQLAQPSRLIEIPSGESSPGWRSRSAQLDARPVRCAAEPHFSRGHYSLTSRRETAELAIDRYVRSGNVVGLGSGLIVRHCTATLHTSLATTRARTASLCCCPSCCSVTYPLTVHPSGTAQAVTDEQVQMRRSTRPSTTCPASCRRAACRTCSACRHRISRPARRPSAACR